MRPAVCPAPTGLPLFEGGPPVEDGSRPGTHPSVPDRVPSGGGHFGDGDGCCSND